MKLEISDESISDMVFALRHAIVVLSDKLRAGLNNGHSDRNSIDWWERFEADIDKIKSLRLLIDQIEGEE